MMALWRGPLGLLVLVCFSSTSFAQTAPDELPEPAVPPAPAPAPEPAPAPAPPPAPEANLDAQLEALAAEEETAGEVIYVTGSRIHTNLDNTEPVVNVTSEDIARSGLTSVGDLLQKLPTSGGALNSKFNSSGNAGFPPDGGGVGAGAAEADLRYLGSKRVLVLVDGMRWVNGSSASGVPSAIDLNTIPAAIIDRIEILEDGASAVYGSDAISGVINIITKRNVEGVFAKTYVGGYHQRDGITQEYNVTAGNRTDRMNVVIGASYVNQAEVSSGDRAISRFPVPGIGACTSGCSSGTPKGRFKFKDPNTGKDVDVTLNDGLAGHPVYDPNNPNSAGDFNAFDTEDRFNFAPYNLVQTPSRRTGVYSFVNYKLAPKVSVYGRALFNNRRSVNQAAPEPLFVGPESGNGGRLDHVSIDATNPYNPFGFTLDATTNPYFVGRRPIEAGPRHFSQNVNTWFFGSGLNGSFEVGRPTFYWDANVSYSINRADQVKTGGFNSARLQRALGPVDACNAEPGCVPFNIFGGAGTITPEMLEYVTFVQKDLSEQRMTDVTANLSADLLTLPGGNLGVAIGVEHRRHQGFFEPDSVVVAGESADVPANPTSGKFDVTEAYGEIRVPLLKELPGANLLDVSGAVRHSDYSTFGSEQTWKASTRWRPVRDLLFRGSYSQGFRAPGIGELFGSEARFDQTLIDPCSDMLGLKGGQPAPQAVVDNCIALGVPADGSYAQLNPQISVTTGGNRRLRPETSKNYATSMVYSPSWLKNRSWIDGFNVELGYYRVKLEGAISAVDAQVQLDSCVQTMDPVMCAGIARTGAGSINGFANQLTNIGGIQTDGLDLNLSYQTPKSAAGQFRLSSFSSFLLEYSEKIPAAVGFQTVKREGTEVGDPQRAFPRFKSSLVLDWMRDHFRASVTARYIHAITEPCRDLGEYGVCSNPNMTDDSLSTNRLDPTVYTDAQVGFQTKLFDNDFDLTIGVNNFTNQDPPICYSCPLNGFDATTYDTPGVFGYVNAGYRL